MFVVLFLALYIFIYYYYGVTPVGNTQRYYIAQRLGGEEKREKTGKKWEKVVGFSSGSLFPARKREAVTQGVIGEIDYPTWRRTQGAVILKGWKGKWVHGRIVDTFTTSIIFDIWRTPPSPGPLHFWGTVAAIWFSLDSVWGTRSWLTGTTYPPGLDRCVSIATHDWLSDIFPSSFLSI